MKATLEFDLNDFDERMAHMRCAKSTEMAIVLFEIAYNLRKQVERKMEAEEMKGNELDPYEVLDLTMVEILRHYDENGILIDDLIR